MSSLQNLVNWVKDRTVRKKKLSKSKQLEPNQEKKQHGNRKQKEGAPGSNRSSLYGFHRSHSKGLQGSNERVCENTLYHRSTSNCNHRRNSPFRLYNDSPAHIYEEIPCAMVGRELRELPCTLVPTNEIPFEPSHTVLDYNIRHFNFDEAKEIGPYLVVPIRKRVHNTNDKPNNLSSQDLVNMVHSTENLLTANAKIDAIHMCSDSGYSSQHDPQTGNDLNIGSDLPPINDCQNGRFPKRTTQVIAEIHHQPNFTYSLDHNCNLEEFVHCKKCSRPHGIYNDEFMDHYDHESDDNVFDEPDLIKDSHAKRHTQGKEEKLCDPVSSDYILESDESVYGVREQIYGAIQDLEIINTPTCNLCATEIYGTYQQTVCSNCDKDIGDYKDIKLGNKSRTPHWKRYVSMGHVRALFNKDGDRDRTKDGDRDRTKDQYRRPGPSPNLDIPANISYSTVSTRLSPNTQLLLDGRHYKTLPIDLVTPVKPSGIKKPFGYDKLELSNKKSGNISSVSGASHKHGDHNNISDKTCSDILEQTPPVGPPLIGHQRAASWSTTVPSIFHSQEPHDSNKVRSFSCSDVIDDDDLGDVLHYKKGNTSLDECEYMSMTHGSPRRGASLSLSSSSDLSPTYCVSLEKKKAKILKSISKSKESLINLNALPQKLRPNSEGDSSIYDCDAETKRKINLLTRNKLSSTWNGPRPPPKEMQLSRNSTLPHSFSPNPRRPGPPSSIKVGLPLRKTHLTRSSDSLLSSKQLSSRDFYTLNRNSGFPSALYLKQGGFQSKLHGHLLRRRRFTSSTDCLLTSTITEEPNSNSSSLEKLSCRVTQNDRSRRNSFDANAQTYTNSAAIIQNQGCYARRHNPILTDLMRVNNDRQTLMLV